MVLFRRTGSGIPDSDKEALSTSTLELKPARTALVVIDLQQGITALPTEPRSSEEVIANASRLAEAVRNAGGLVVLVHVGPSPEGRDALSPLTDNPPVERGKPPEGWDQIVPQMGPKPGDHVVRKRQWGAFYGTDLDLQRRRRRIDTIFMTGIPTNIGVESTARDAYERGYQQIFVEDAMADLSGEAHTFSLEHVLRRIGRIRTTAEVIDALKR